jgi:hypothetical protein
MGRSARITSIETLADFRSALAVFGADVRDTLCAVDMHIHRMFDWLEERGKYWQREIRVREEEVTRAKIDLNARKNMKKDGYGPGTTDQEKALRKAVARLKEAQDKLASCRRWKPLLDHAVREYQGPARVLASTLDIDLVNSLALLAQKLAALEAYLALAPPPIAPLAGRGESAESPSMATSEATNTGESTGQLQEAAAPVPVTTVPNEEAPGHESDQQQ